MLRRIRRILIGVAIAVFITMSVSISAVYIVNHAGYETLKLITGVIGLTIGGILFH